jgi:hypothetical protein
VPKEVAFATKPQIACDLIAAALDAGTPCAWVLADATYGCHSRLRRMLEARGQPYVLATRSNHVLRMLTGDGLVQTGPAEMADALPAAAWRAHAAGEGSKGPRLYDWAEPAKVPQCAALWKAGGGAHRSAVDGGRGVRTLGADPPQQARCRRAGLLLRLRAGRRRAR